MSTIYERLISGLLAVAAILLAAVLVHREFGKPHSVAPSTSQVAQWVPQWERVLASGVVVGDSMAPVKVVELGDFECPFCRRFEESLRKAVGPRKDVALVFVHYPLASHRFAMPAARVSQCAFDQGKFAEVHDLLFAKQDSLGLKAWDTFGRDVGVRDTARFRICAAQRDTVAKITAGQHLGGLLNIHGTPTVIINGWQFAGAPRDSILSLLISAARVGKDSLGKIVRKL